MNNIEFFKGEGVKLGYAPINPAWVIEGKPLARNYLVSKSLDGSGFTYLWDCTEGVFNWHYDIDETVYIIEGSATIRDDEGKRVAVDCGRSRALPRWLPRRLARRELCAQSRLLPSAHSGASVVPDPCGAEAYTDAELGFRQRRYGFYGALKHG